MKSEVIIFEVNRSSCLRLTNLEQQWRFSQLLFLMVGRIRRKLSHFLFSLCHFGSWPPNYESVDGCHGVFIFHVHRQADESDFPSASMWTLLMLLSICVYCHLENKCNKKRKRGTAVSVVLLLLWKMLPTVGRNFALRCWRFWEDKSTPHLSPQIQKKSDSGNFFLSDQEVSS